MVTCAAQSKNCLRLCRMTRTCSKRSNAAFPSSHSANAFAVAFVIARRWRRAAVPAFAFAALVAWSRMYLDRHWLSDVVVGAALALGLAWLTSRAWRRWRETRNLSATA